VPSLTGPQHLLRCKSLSGPGRGRRARGASRARRARRCSGAGGAGGDARAASVAAPATSLAPGDAGDDGLAELRALVSAEAGETSGALWRALRARDRDASGLLTAAEFGAALASARVRVAISGGAAPCGAPSAGV
jgi:hypothetical protein